MTQYVKWANISQSGYPPLRLLSAGMAETAQERVRRGFWLRMARERSGLTQSDVAQRLGYSARSASDQ